MSVTREAVPVSDMDLTGLTWHKSSYSGMGGNDNCVELAYQGSLIAIRDSKNPTGPTLIADPTALLNHLRRRTA